LRYEITNGFLEALIEKYFTENHYNRVGLLLNFLLRRTPMWCKKGTIVSPKSKDLKLLDHKMSLKVTNYCATWTSSYYSPAAYSRRKGSNTNLGLKQDAIISQLLQTRVEIKT